jgi:biopolymer transport protein TolQ
MPTTPLLAALGPQELLGLLLDTSLLGKIVMLVLLVLSVLSWAVMFDKARTLARIRAGHSLFWDRCDAWLDGEATPESVTAWCLEHRDLPLANMWTEAANLGSAAHVRRTSERVAYAEIEALERYLIILSTTVTISPFLGLMGTVWGIMQAFWDMSAMHSANLTVVAPGIAEALVTTIAGLSAAIPAVVFYNMFVRKIDLVGNEMDRLRSVLEEEVMERTGQTQARQRPTRRPDTHAGERIR